jgi:hypothetical protein
LEVDFVIGDEVVIEVKATERVRKNDLKGLRAQAEELPLKRKLLSAWKRLPGRRMTALRSSQWRSFFRNFQRKRFNPNKRRPDFLQLAP